MANETINVSVKEQIVVRICLYLLRVVVKWLWFVWFMTSSLFRKTSWGCFQDTEMKLRITGAKSVMMQFLFFVWLLLGENFTTNHQSHALYSSSISAAQENILAQDVVKTLLTDWSHESFDFLWAGILQRKHKEIKSIEDPVPRSKRKSKERFELGNHHSTNKSILKPLILHLLPLHQDLMRRT